MSDICRYGRVFLLQWQKAAKARRKVRERSEYHYLYKICTRKHDHNSLSRFCWGAKGRERVAKARRKGQFWGTNGNHNFEQPPNKQYSWNTFPSKSGSFFFGKDLAAASRFANDGQQTDSSLYPT